MSEAELYERYLEERQWNYMSWEDYKEIWKNREEEHEREVQGLRGKEILGESV